MRFGKKVEIMSVTEQRKARKALKTLGFLNLEISSDNNLIAEKQFAAAFGATRMLPLFHVMPP